MVPPTPFERPDRSWFVPSKMSPLGCLRLETPALSQKAPGTQSTYPEDFQFQETTIHCEHPWEASLIAFMPVDGTERE